MEKFVVKTEPDTQENDDTNSASADCKLTPHVRPGASFERMNNQPVKNEFQRTSEDEISSDMFIQLAECTSVHHVDLDLSDMFLLKKTIKVEPNDIEMNCDDPLSLTDLNNVSGHSVINSMDSEISKKVGVPNDENPYKCETCGKSYAKMASLTMHNWAHSSEKRFKCDMCEKGFRTSYCLTNHRLVHTEENLHKCETCGKSYGLLSRLTRHKLTHTTEKRFECDVCGMKMKTPHGLAQHKSEQHVGIKRREYNCKTCGKSYSQTGSLTRHMLTHSDEKPFSCDLCDKSFAASNTLSRHRKTHEKPYKCETCGKGFNRSNNLTQHMMIHTQKLQKLSKSDLCEENVPTYTYKLIRF